MQAANALGLCLGIRISGMDSSVEGTKRGIETKSKGSTSNQHFSCSSNLNIQNTFFRFYPDVGYYIYRHTTDSIQILNQIIIKLFVKVIKVVSI